MRNPLAQDAILATLGAWAIGSSATSDIHNHSLSISLPRLDPAYPGFTDLVSRCSKSLPISSGRVPELTFADRTCAGRSCQIIPELCGTDRVASQVPRLSRLSTRKICFQGRIQQQVKDRRRMGRTGSLSHSRSRAHGLSRWFAMASPASRIRKA